jgi:6-phosphogluconolactonase
MVSSEAFAEAAAHLIAAELWAAVGQRGQATIAISGGNTPLPVLTRLASLELPWRQTTWLWVDERFVPASDARSNVGNARRVLFDRVAAAQVLAPQGPEFGDLSAVSMRYARDVRAALKASVSTADPNGAFDVVLLGIGDDGHTASLFPGAPEVMCADDVVLPVPARAGREPRITLSSATLIEARVAIVLAQGAKKREPVARARTWPAGAYLETPAHLLAHRTRPTFWVVDPDASGPAV